MVRFFVVLTSKVRLDLDLNSVEANSKLLYFYYFPATMLLVIVPTVYNSVALLEHNVASIFSMSKICSAAHFTIRCHIHVKLLGTLFASHVTSNHDTALPRCILWDQPLWPTLLLCYLYGFIPKRRLSYF